MPIDPSKSTASGKFGYDYENLRYPRSLTYIAMQQSMMTEHLQRVVVIGSSCAGKTTFAKELARRLDSTHIELDAIHWMPNWVAREKEEFRQLVARAITAKHWVADGNYSAVRNVLWPRATAIIWLNYSVGVVAPRAIRRTLRRSLWNEELYAGNRESLRRAFLSRDSILWWIIKTFRRHRREFQELRTDNTFPNLEWIEFRTPTEATAFLRRMETVRMGQTNLNALPR